MSRSKIAHCHLCGFTLKASSLVAAGKLLKALNLVHKCSTGVGPSGFEGRDVNEYERVQRRRAARKPSVAELVDSLPDDSTEEDW